MLLAALTSALVVAIPVSAQTSPSADGPVARDVAYASSSPQQVLDVYGGASPDGATAPVVILVHGGGWTTGDKSRLAGVATVLGSQGFVVFNINYRLGKQAVPAYRQQVDDVRRALEWVRTHAARYGGDANRIGLLGGSAGGYLAAMVATTAGPMSGVRAAVSLSGPMDITSLVDLIRATRRELGPDCSGPRCDDLATAVSSLHALLGCNPFRCPPRVLASASPITHVSAESPPFFLANSRAEDVPASQARDMAGALTRMGVPVELSILAGHEHSLGYVHVIGDAVIRFLKNRLAAGTPPADLPARDPGRGFPWRGLGLATLVGLAAIGVFTGVLRVGRRAL